MVVVKDIDSIKVVKALEGIQVYYDEFLAKIF
jgi:hypothetical protein